VFVTCSARGMRQGSRAPPAAAARRAGACAPPARAWSPCRFFHLHPPLPRSHPPTPAPWPCTRRARVYDHPAWTVLGPVRVKASPARVEGEHRGARRKDTAAAPPGMCTRTAMQPRQTWPWVAARSYRRRVSRVMRDCVQSSRDFRVRAVITPPVRQSLCNALFCSGMHLRTHRSVTVWVSLWFCAPLLRRPEYRYTGLCL
jgi:hypothetical protein